MDKIKVLQLMSYPIDNIINYINDEIRDTISTDDSVTNDFIIKGYFTEEDFIEKCVVEIDDD